MTRMQRFVPRTAFLMLPLLASSALGAKPTAQEALKLVPIQTPVDFDRPAAAVAEKCVVQPHAGVSGWIVTTESGQVLRRFLDTNGDGNVDQWCYYKSGIEVYRDIDANFNGKADAYRWLGMAGTRWGVDTDEDGRIDSWKVISAEELTAELIIAIREQDKARFQRILLTPEELKGLGLGADQAGELAAKITQAPEQFAEITRKQKAITAKSEWIYFGGSRPGVAPAGVNGATKDVTIYDNVSAVVETEGKHAQVAVGTLVKVDQGWRLIDAPQSLLGDDPAQGAGGHFFVADLVTRPAVEGAEGAGISEEMQKLIAELDRLDKVGPQGTAPQLAKVHSQRADILERLSTVANSDEERSLWARQFADRVSSAVQEGAYPDGLSRLKAFAERMQKSGAKDLAAYASFRYMTSEYGQLMQDPKADMVKVQANWLEKLKTFVQDYPTSPDAAEAMLQLAIAEEFAGKEDEAVRWYSRIVQEFDGAEVAKKAAGAKRRMESVGKSIELQGRTIDGKVFDLAAARGYVVVIHYWATWCEPCKQDIETLKKLQAKYAGQKLAFIGINLDNDRKQLEAYLKTNRISWAQLYEQGGLDSRLAAELGVLTLPTMLVIDRQGKVANRGAHAAELDSELGKLLR